MVSGDSTHRLTLSVHHLKCHVNYNVKLAFVTKTIEQITQLVIYKEKNSALREYLPMVRYSCPDTWRINSEIVHCPCQYFMRQDNNIRAPHAWPVTQTLSKINPTV